MGINNIIYYKLLNCVVSTKNVFFFPFSFFIFSILFYFLLTSLKFLITMRKIQVMIDYNCKFTSRMYTSYLFIYLYFSLFSLFACKVFLNTRKSSTGPLQGREFLAFARRLPYIS